MHHIVWLIFDSARYDAFQAARTPHMDRIAPAARCMSYASWTAPSHYNFLLGIPPHPNRRDVFSSVRYREDLAAWRDRIGDEAMRYSDFLPRLSLPAVLRGLGYRTEAYVSLPVLNPSTLLARDFDVYRLMPSHNDLAAIIDEMSFDGPRRFFFVNTGETHYPYLLPGETADDLPRLSGLHGTLHGLDEFLREPSRWGDVASPSSTFTPQRLRGLWEKQVACIEHLDGVVGDLLERAPTDTWFMVTSDHGELFGEDGFFGHGPIVHEKVFEVFFLEGPHPGR